MQSSLDLILRLHDERLGRLRIERILGEREVGLGPLLTGLIIPILHSVSRPPW